jgi:hypothetical protein
MHPMTALSQTSCSAVFSRCRTYRYELWRRWADGGYCMFVGLNPSTADECNDDPTIRKCMSYAKRWGYAALCMTNLFAFRATDPRDMKGAAEPIGVNNDTTLITLAARAEIIVAAWGICGTHIERDRAVCKILPQLYALHITKDGHPGHPLYLRGDALPYPFNHE